ncbi:MAG: hypothetical protein R2697_22250 [Ilumatobacteraceae bacterium]
MTEFEAFQAVTDGDDIERGVTTLDTEVLPDGVLVEVHYSTRRFKDELASTPSGKVARVSPMVPHRPQPCPARGRAGRPAPR